VARTGHTRNISDPYSDPDFNPEVDRRTGYRTESILCMPIFDRNKQVLAVAQLLNKRGGQAFSAEDEQSFSDFALPLGLILESCLRMTPARAVAPA
jgi:adenylate cyclase